MFELNVPLFMSINMCNASYFYYIFIYQTTIAQIIDIPLKHTLFPLWMFPQRDNNPVHIVV